MRRVAALRLLSSHQASADETAMLELCAAAVVQPPALASVKLLLTALQRLPL